MKYKPGTFSITPNKELLRGKPSAMQSIFFWLCDHMDDNGICYPARRTLSKEAGCDVKTTDKYLTQLETDGFISKTTRKKPNSKENASNIYQIMIIEVGENTPQGSTEFGATVGEIRGHPSTKNGAVTIPSELYPLTIHTQPSVVPNQEGNLPLSFGKSYILRLHYVYRYLWRKKYGVKLTSSNIGAFGKAMKSLIENNTEQQIAVLLFTFFNWYGGNGNDEKENLYLSGKGFPAYLMINKIDIFLAYLTNSVHLCYDKPEDIELFLRKNLKEIF